MPAEPSNSTKRLNILREVTATDQPIPHANLDNRMAKPQTHGPHASSGSMPWRPHSGGCSGPPQTYGIRTGASHDPLVVSEHMKVSVVLL